MRRALLLLALAAPLPAPLAAQAPDRSHPPQPGPVRPFHLPPLRTFTLSNGLPVTLVEKHEIPVASVQLAVASAGATADPAGRPGIAALTAQMLYDGAGGKDALALDDAVTFLGAELTTSAGWDAATVRLHVPVARLAPALALMSDVVLRPDFPEKEWARVRKERLTDFVQERSEPDVLAARALARAVFGEKHRYGAPVNGTAAVVASATVAEMKAFHAERWRPGAAALFVAGDVTVESVKPLLESAFGSWKGGAPAPASVPPPPQVTGRTIVLVDKPGAAQSALRAGRVGPERKTPDYVALQVMNTLLGGSFTSRLNDNLREQHGWSYGAFSRFDYRRTAGVFAAIADVDTPHTAPGLSEMLKEIARMGTPAAEEEVKRARNYVALRYAENFETADALTTRLAEAFVQGFPPSDYDAFVPAALGVGPELVAKTARRFVDPKALAIVVVGDRKAVEQPVRGLKAGEVRVWSVDQVMGPAPKVE